jgi:hypothetical protein
MLSFTTPEIFPGLDDPVSSSSFSHELVDTRSIAPKIAMNEINIVRFMMFPHH